MRSPTAPTTPLATGAGSNGAAPGAAHGRGDVPRTDFAQYSHQELIAMLAAADPESAHRTAGQWQHTAALMSEQASALDGELAGFSDNWQGDAAVSYQVMVKDLAGGVRQVADHARRMRDLSANAADALDTARATMPAPVDVPSISPETMAVATTPIAADPTASATTLLAAQRQQGQAVAAVQAQQAAQGAADAAQAQAVQVMTTLADSYTDSAASIPASPYAPDGSVMGLAGGAPAGGSAAPLFGKGSGVGGLGGVGGAGGSLGDLVDPVTGQLIAGAEGVSANVPLFGSMFTAGLAAASAAAVGRFGSLMPRLPSFLTRRTTPEIEGSGSLFDPLTGRPLNPAETGEDLTKPTAGLVGAGAGGAGAGGGGGGASLGGLGGLGGGLGGLGGGAIAGGIGAAAPSAYTALAGSAAGAGGLPAAAGVSGLSAGAAGVASGVGGASAAHGGMPMGMMPMGQGMGGGMDGARRSPAWLVETDDVWGEQSVVAPSVVGDDAPPPDPRPWVSGR